MPQDVLFVWLEIVLFKNLHAFRKLYSTDFFLSHSFQLLKRLHYRHRSSRILLFFCLNIFKLINLLVDFVFFLRVNPEMLFFLIEIFLLPFFLLRLSLKCRHIISIFRYFFNGDLLGFDLLFFDMFRNFDLVLGGNFLGRTCCFSRLNISALRLSFKGFGRLWVYF